MTTSQRGFTLIEVLVAVVVLGIGVVALAGSSAMVSRMIGRGQTTTLAAQVATRRLEWLRGLAASTTPPCTSVNLISGAATYPGGSESWQIGAGVQSRTATVFVTYRLPGGRGTRTDTVSTLISCFS